MPQPDHAVVGCKQPQPEDFEVSSTKPCRCCPRWKRKTVVTESGITGKADVEFMQTRGVHTFLIGETFMRADNIEAEVGKLF